MNYSFVKDTIKYLLAQKNISLYKKLLFQNILQYWNVSSIHIDASNVRISSHILSYGRTPVLLPQKLNFKVSYVSFSCWKCIEVWNLHTCRYFGRFLCPQSSFVCKRAFINRNQSRLCRHKFCMADLLSKHKFLASNGENNTLLLKRRLCFRAVWGSEEIFPKNYPQEDIV